MGTLRPLPEKTLAPSLIDFGEIQEFGPCTRQSGSQHYHRNRNFDRPKIIFSQRQSLGITNAHAKAASPLTPTWCSGRSGVTMPASAVLGSFWSSLAQLQARQEPPPVDPREVDPPVFGPEAPKEVGEHPRVAVGADPPCRARLAACGLPKQMGTRAGPTSGPGDVGTPLRQGGLGRWSPPRLTLASRT